MLYRIFVLFVICLTLTSASIAEPNESLVRIGQWSAGACRAAATDGLLTYIGSGAQLEIVDFANPADPQKLGHLNLSAEIYDVKKQGNLLYLACADLGLRIVDVSNPYWPLLIGGLETGNDAWDIELVGTFAYVVDGYYGLFIIDVSDPANPVLIGSYNIPGVTRGVAIDGDFAYLATDNFGFRIVNISNPAAPYQVAVYMLADWRAKHIDLVDHYAVVAGGSDGVSIFDISIPTNPTVVIHFNTGDYAWRLKVRDWIAYVANQPGGFNAIDIRNPQQPIIVDTVLTGERTEHVALSESYAYIPMGDSGVSVVDITDPADMVPVGSCHTGTGAWNLTADDNYAYVCSSGLAVVDISNPAAPETISGIPGFLFALDVKLYGDYLYVADYDTGLKIVDVSDPFNPVICGMLPTGNYASDLAIRDDIAYIANAYSGLMVADISDPMAPEEIWASSIAEAYTLCLKDNFLYVAGSDLLIYDITDPRLPVLVGTWDGIGIQQTIALNGDFAYIGSFYNGIDVIDVSDPTTPVRVNEVDLADSDPIRITIENNLAYVCYWHEGFRVYDISNPMQILPCGNYDLFSYDVVLSNEQIYVSSTELGFSILRYVPLAATPDTQDGVSHISAWPNPFALHTTIQYSLDQTSGVDLRIYDIAGRLVKTLIRGEHHEVGSYQIEWNGTDEKDRDVSAGVYFMLLNTPTRTERKRITLSR
jgi:hypothetical protein